jgi:hypothetical protein
MKETERQRELSPSGHDWTYEEHRRRQTRRGLEMTPAERLEWLEQTVAELHEIQGRARSS